MTIQVDISDRCYDYTDEEKAVEAIEEFQLVNGIDEKAVLAIWQDEKDPRRWELEKMIFEAVDANGSAKRAQDNIPGGITLSLG